MATVRGGNKSALLIVDVQVGVMQNAWNAQQVIANIAITWLSYPGRENTTAGAEDVSFD